MSLLQLSVVGMAHAKSAPLAAEVRTLWYACLTMSDGIEFPHSSSEHTLTTLPRLAWYPPRPPWYQGQLALC